MPIIPARCRIVLTLEEGWDCHCIERRVETRKRRSMFDAGAIQGYRGYNHDLIQPMVRLSPSFVALQDAFTFPTSE